MVCPRRQHEDEAEVTDDTSERHHLDSVEMSRLCTDWPRTLDQQRAKAYIALVLAPCSPFSMSNDVCPFLQRCALVALLQLHRVRESPHPARPPSVQNTPSLACLWTLDSGLWTLESALPRHGVAAARLAVLGAPTPGSPLRTPRRQTTRRFHPALLPQHH
ncbi:hypothetical protein HBH68_157040 [Parastagonospora nodorum]|nr:hypothetical protein HBH49_165940 [Parastagonospora nodorum]KAH4220061.1 hypothetical protein HBI06_180600 [Parastagonospora nodorum]KAH4227413.1 hypothetical protein HBI05_212490 [Parastagonospora nodorum]KAH5188728.1 hypothetical protein HBH68_157040 [Parastagonospora nodorum]KAH6362149.1 hypothetical protein HBI34_183610 [Parastagonospora nodorum]